ncbi:hypothetical protein L345_15590, partial [Ophiophagus hannah]
TKSKFSHLGHLVAILGICCVAKLDQKNVHTDVIKWKHQEFLETWNPMVFLKNPSRVAEVFSIYFSPREKTDFLLTVLDGLTDTCSNFSLAATESLLASIARTCGPEMEKVPDIIEGICSRLNLIRRPSTRRLLMKLVGLLAGRTEHLDTVISSLLEHSISTDSSPSELWRSLSAEEMIEEQLLENLLSRLQSQHKMELQPPSLSISLTQALYEVISVLESRDTIQGLFPELLMTFLVELHFRSQRDSLPDVDVLQQCGQVKEPCYIFAALRLSGSWICYFLSSAKTLLHYQDIDQFPSEQIFESLEEWTQNSSPDIRSLALRALGILAIHPDKVRKGLRPGCDAGEGEGQHITTTLCDAACCCSQADAKVRNSAIVLFAELPNMVKKKEKYLIQEQGCQDALLRCFRFLGWSLPKKISSKKAWHDHPHDPDPSVRMAAMEAMQMVQDACGGPSITLQSQTHFNLDREERLFSQGHWEAPDPSLTHRWNPSSPVSHRIVTGFVRRRQSGAARQT